MACKGIFLPQVESSFCPPALCAQANFAAVNNNIQGVCTETGIRNKFEQPEAAGRTDSEYTV